MPRKPFDPTRVPDQDDGDMLFAGPVADGPSPRRGGACGKSGDHAGEAIPVAALAGMVKTALSQALPSPVRVVGEVSNFSNRNHWFFSLKDADATLSCVCFATAARKVGFDMRDGMEVVCTGRVDFYEQYGKLQLYVDRIEPVGQGALELKFKQLCEELRAAGYFEIDRKKPLPAVPRKVAVVTSRAAAALQDVINTAHRRWPGCQLLLFDTRVQGDLAAPEIARAIRSLSDHGEAMGIDAVILTRGGGSIEDLWAFNEREVADALFDCSLPVVAAIGHETDTTVAELVADLRCATPTQAAMQLIPDKQALEHQVAQLAHRLTSGLHRRAQLSRQRLEAIARHPIFRRPQHMYDPWRQRLDSLGRALGATLPRLATQQRERLNALHQRLEAVSPSNVLQRGYTYTTDAAGNVIRSAQQPKPGDVLATVFHDGRVDSRVIDEHAPRQGEPDSRDAATGSMPSGAASPKPATSKRTPRRGKRKRRPSDDGPTLFDG